MMGLRHGSGAAALLAILVCVLCVASMGRADVSRMTTTLSSSSSSSSAAHPQNDLFRFTSTRGVVAPSPVECYRKVFPKELDQKLLAFDIVEARVAIQEKLSLLDRFHFEVEHGLLEADCLSPYYAYMAGDHNMDELMRCNEELLDAVVQPLIDDLANLTSQA